jgi:hypothetical protein
MERQKAVIASALLAGSLMTGGVAFAISGGALDGQQDNVGKLQPTTAVVTAPEATSTVSPSPQDAPSAPATAPAVTAAPPTAPPSTVSQASPAAEGRYEDDDDHEQDEHEQESDEHESEDDDD